MHGSAHPPQSLRRLSHAQERTQVVQSYSQPLSAALPGLGASQASMAGPNAETKRLLPGCTAAAEQSSIATALLYVGDAPNSALCALGSTSLPTAPMHMIYALSTELLLRPQRVKSGQAAGKTRHYRRQGLPGLGFSMRMYVSGPPHDPESHITACAASITVSWL